MFNFVLFNHFPCVLNGNILYSDHSLYNPATYYSYTCHQDIFYISDFVPKFLITSSEVSYFILTIIRKIMQIMN